MEIRELLFHDARLTLDKLEQSGNKDELKRYARLMHTLINAIEKFNSNEL